MDVQKVKLSFDKINNNFKEFDFDFKEIAEIWNWYIAFQEKTCKTRLSDVLSPGEYYYWGAKAIDNRDSINLNWANRTLKSISIIKVTKLKIVYKWAGQAESQTVNRKSCLRGYLITFDDFQELKMKMKYARQMELVYDLFSNLGQYFQYSRYQLPMPKILEILKSVLKIMESNLHSEADS